MNPHPRHKLNRRAFPFPIGMLWAIWFCAWCGAANAQFAQSDAFAARSVSGQFLVYSMRLDDPSALPPELAANTNYVLLDQSLLAVASERIKQSLCRELDAPPAWRGKIHLTLRPARGEDDPVTIVSERFRSGWNYRVELPQVLERQRFVRAIVQSLLLEMANRNAGERSAEIPAWLTEGLTQHLLGSRETELVPPSPQWGTRGLAVSPSVINARRTDPLAAARRTLSESTPLTLAELSWPSEEQLTGAAGEAYRRSAQLFVTELFRLRNGRESLRALLDELPGCYNWQTAFFRAFQRHFTRQLDLEKWWALQVVNCTGRDPDQLWTVEESSRQIEQLLRTPVEVRRAASELPTHTDVTPQAVIREWDFPGQSLALKNRMRDLELARARMAPEFIGLTDEYRQALAAYLQRRDRVDFVAVAKKTAPTAKAMAQEVIRQLDALDARRKALRPPETPVNGTGEDKSPPAP